VAKTNQGIAMTFYSPPEFDARLRAAAQRRFQSKSEYVRQAIIARLQADGVDAVPPADETHV
jgi:hypothetical protein